MSRRPRVFSLETLEGRRLLSHSAPLTLGNAPILAKQKTITMSVNGTIAGTTGYYHNPSNFNETTAFFDASGNLPVLGLVQTTALIPDTGTKTQRGTMTLATSEGTLTFKVIDKPRSPTELTVQSGTGAYAGYTGSGTVDVRYTEFGYHHIFTDSNAFKLKLKS